MSENLGRAARARLIASSLVLCCAMGCERVKPNRRDARTSPDVAAEPMGSALRNATVVPLNARRELTENSAAAMSVRQPGVLFTINDSGHDPELFAVDTTGADRGVWRVSGAMNVDWEAASLGPCAGQESANAPFNCIYIGDTGENGPHQSRAIYRVVEPDADGRRGAVQAEVMLYTYPDQRHDVEAMYVARNGDVVLITKRPITDRRGRLRPALVFRIPASAWSSRERVVAQLVDSLPIVPGSVPFRLITDASLAPDGHHIAVRTYSQVFIFATDSVTGSVNHAVEPRVCDLTGLGEAQGEGVSWINDRGRLVFTSEGRRAPLNLGDCSP